MMIEEFILLLQIIFIDLVLAADNVLIIGIIASKFRKNQKKKLETGALYLLFSWELYLHLLLPFLYLCTI